MGAAIHSNTVDMRDDHDDQLFAHNTAKMHLFTEIF